MKNVFAFLTMASLVGCGSAAEIAAALRETPVPTETNASAPGIVWTATPYPAMPAKDISPTASPTVAPRKEEEMMADYKKISKGMTIEQIFQILGTAQKESDSVNCFNGECTEYHWCYWYYGSKELTVRFVSGIANYTTAY